MKNTIYCIIVSMIAAAFIPRYAGAETGQSFFREIPGIPWHITADEIEYDQKGNRYVAKGNVTVFQGDRKLSADVITFDYKVMKAFAEGHVMMTAGEDVLTGTRIEADLKSETGTISDGIIFLEQNHLYIKGSLIQKTGEAAYEARDASLTACDGDSPAWKITGKSLEVTLEGYGFAKHAALWIKGIPVMYVPFFVFPAKQKRQSGLLIPEMEISDRKGLSYQQPLYWAINENSDATFCFNPMEKRGLRLGTEYRYVRDKQSKGTVMADFLNDRQRDDGTADSGTRWGYEDDTALRPNADRYWFRMKADQEIVPGFLAKLDIDIVSDQDYLHEFKDGYMGADNSDEYFGKTFGRGMEDYSDPVRRNSLGLSSLWQTCSLNTGIRWYDDVIARRQSDTDTSLQQLPYVRFNSVKQRIPYTPVYGNFAGDYTYFFRKDGTSIHRADIYPRIYLPLRFRNYFTVEPSAGLRETFWHSDDTENFRNSADTDNRQTYDIRLALSSDLFKVFDPGPGISALFSGTSRIQHRISPQIVYEYIPEGDQGEYPESDYRDQVEKKNQLTYSLTNTFTARSQTAEGASPSYRQFCRFKLEQSYHINDESDETDRPFSPVFAEVTLTPGQFLSLKADTLWSVYDNEFQSRNIGLNLWDDRGDRIFAEYRYSEDFQESFFTYLALKLSESLTVRADYERNIRDGKEIRNSLGLLYEAGCWSLDLRHTVEADDRKTAFMVNLYGLGEFGTGK